MPIYSIEEIGPRISSEGLLLNWWDGGPAYILASSSLIQITKRGIITYDRQAKIRDLTSMVNLILKFIP